MAEWIVRDKNDGTRSNTSPIRVMVVDDHDSVRRGLAILLQVFDDMEMVAEAASGSEAVRLCAQFNPDVILMDLMMPGMSGITSTEIIRKRHPLTQIVALSNFKDDVLVQAALDAGAVAYLAKNVSIDEIADAIRLAKG